LIVPGKMRDRAPALAAGDRGLEVHRVVYCQAEGCRWAWYRPWHEPGGSSEPPPQGVRIVTALGVGQRSRQCGSLAAGAGSAQAEECGGWRSFPGFTARLAPSPVAASRSRLRFHFTWRPP
jgi:hypothetical protein